MINLFCFASSNDQPRKADLRTFSNPGAKTVIRFDNTLYLNVHLISSFWSFNLWERHLRKCCHVDLGKRKLICTPQSLK